jgi:hypothetical protein
LNTHGLSVRSAARVPDLVQCRGPRNAYSCRLVDPQPQPDKRRRRNANLHARRTSEAVSTARKY